MLIVSAVFIIPNLYYLATFKRTFGTCIGFFSPQSASYPIIQFSSGDQLINFRAPSFMRQVVHINDSLPVMYNPSNLNKAYVVSFYGLWVYKFIYFLPIFLVSTIAIFSIDFIPKYIKISTTKGRIIFTKA